MPSRKRSRCGASLKTGIIKLTVCCMRDSSPKINRVAARTAFRRCARRFSRAVARPRQNNRRRILGRLARHGEARRLSRLDGDRHAHARRLCEQLNRAIRFSTTRSTKRLSITRTTMRNSNPPQPSCTRMAAEARTRIFRRARDMAQPARARHFGRLKRSFAGR